MGGIYAREDGRPEAVWKAIYHHYLPLGVEADAPPTRDAAGRGRRHLGGRVARRQAGYRRPACSWRASGPPARAIHTGCGARPRGWCAILLDLPELTGVDRGPRSATLLDQAASAFEGDAAEWRPALDAFLLDRVRYVLEQRGSDVRNVRAVTHGALGELAPLHRPPAAAVLPEFTETAEFRTLAVRLQARAQHRAQDAGRRVRRPVPDAGAIVQGLTEPAEQRAGRRNSLARRGTIMFAARYRQRLPRGTRRGREVRAQRGHVLRRCPGDGRRSRRSARHALSLMKALERQILQSGRCFRDCSCRSHKHAWRKRFQTTKTAVKQSPAAKKTAGEETRKARRGEEVRLLLRQRQGRRQPAR